MGPTHRWRVDIFVDIRSNDRLGSLDFAEGDIPDGPDYAETVASNGYYSFKKDHTSPMMCWASDSLICAAGSGLDAKRLSMRLTI
jgi:hypothetical protein